MAECCECGDIDAEIVQVKFYCLNCYLKKFDKVAIDKDKLAEEKCKGITPYPQKPSLRDRLRVEELRRRSENEK